MVSTVTTSTVTTVALAALGGAISVIAILVLLALLVQKELASTSASRRAARLSQALTIGIVPLLAAFVVVVAVRVFEVLR